MGGGGEACLGELPLLRLPQPQSPRSTLSPSTELGLWEWWLSDKGKLESPSVHGRCCVEPARRGRCPLRRAFSICSSGSPSSRRGLRPLGPHPACQAKLACPETPLYPGSFQNHPPSNLAPKGCLGIIHKGLSLSPPGVQAVRVKQGLGPGLAAQSVRVHPSTPRSWVRPPAGTHTKINR